MSNWKPIETAPKDIFVLVCDDSKQQYVAMYHEWGWEYASTLFQPSGIFKQDVQFICIPTHWMSLPEPPK